MNENIMQSRGSGDLEQHGDKTIQHNTTQHNTRQDKTRQQKCAPVNTYNFYHHHHHHHHHHQYFYHYTFFLSRAHLWPSRCQVSTGHTGTEDKTGDTRHLTVTTCRTTVWAGVGGRGRG